MRVPVSFKPDDPSELSILAAVRGDSVDCLRNLKASFFERETFIVARDLLGCALCHQTPDGPLVGRIVETEAYLGCDDLASHAARGRTRRNAIMFDAPGHAYVYLSYGNHWCFNVVAFERPPGGVLIRALEPIAGLEAMALRRQRGAGLASLTNGPGKLTQALGIDRAQYGVPLFGDETSLFLSIPDARPSPVVGCGPRIGIRRAMDLPLRFYVRGSAYLSRSERAS